MVSCASSDQSFVRSCEIWEPELCNWKAKVVCMHPCRRRSANTALGSSRSLERVWYYKHCTLSGESSMSTGGTGLGFVWVYLQLLCKLWAFLEQYHWVPLTCYCNYREPWIYCKECLVCVWRSCTVWETEGGEIGQRTCENREHLHILVFDL